MNKPYQAPRVQHLGSLQARTMQNNKIGPNADIYTSIGVPIVGDITPLS